MNVGVPGANQIPSGYVGHALHGRYLQPGWWRGRSAAYRGAREYTCERCGLRGYDVHHRSWERLGGEIDEDLVLLCRGWHDLARHRPPPSFDELEKPIRQL